MKNADQTNPFNSQRVVAIVGLQIGCEVPKVFRGFRDAYIGALCSFVLNQGKQINEIVILITQFEELIQSSPIHGFNEVVCYRIVRDLVACFTIACPQYVHELLDQRMITIVKDGGEKTGGSRLSTSLYCQAALTGIVKGLYKYWCLANFDVSDLFCTAGEKVGQCIAIAHTNSQLCDSIIPEMESDLGREVVAISHLMYNPFGKNFLTSVWKGLGEDGRGRLFNQQYALTRAIIMAFAVRHIASLSIWESMNMIVPPEPVQPS